MTPTDTIFERDFDFIIKQTQNDKFPVKKIPLKFLRNEHPEDYKIPQVFRPLVTLSKWMIACPVKISYDRTYGKVIYEFKRLSVQFIFAFMVGIAIMAVVIFWFLNTVVDTDWPVRL